MNETPSTRGVYVDLSDSTASSDRAAGMVPDERKSLLDGMSVEVEKKTSLRPYWVKLDIKVPLDFE